MEEPSARIQEVPENLFAFEEKIFGLITIPQLLSDVVVVMGLIMLTQGFSLVSRLLLGGFLSIPILLFIHLKVHHITLAHWVFLWGRFHLLRKEISWPSSQKPTGWWFPLTLLQGGMAGYQEQGNVSRFWAVMELQGRNISLLPRQEQEQMCTRFAAFLAGLEFRLQFLSQVQQIPAHAYPPLQAQEKALHWLRHQRLSLLQQASLDYQRQHIQQCTLIKHYVVVEISRQEEALKHLSPMQTLLPFLFHRPSQEASKMEMIDHLRIRCSLLKKVCKQLNIQAHLLDDQAHLQLFLDCLAPGTSVHPPLVLPQPLAVEDILAPFTITIHPDHKKVTTGSQTRVQRTLTIDNYGTQVHAGWVDELLELGLPMLLSTQFEGFENKVMLRSLELQLVKLESSHYADVKSVRLTTATHTVEADRIRLLSKALAARRLKILATTVTITLHASSQEHLEQRTQYLRSYLRQQQMRIHTNLREQDLQWQACLPINAPIVLQQMVRLPSTVCSTFLPCSTGIVGTPTGVFLGFYGSAWNRRPVYYHPWSPDKQIPNPHIVVIGESGMGKSWFGKTLVTGLMGMNIADVVVLDRDDDYLPLHEQLADASQRYNLARHCPINLFDIPFTPEDVDINDPSDLLEEFFDNHLMLALALIITETNTGQAQFAKTQEAYLTQVARAVYAAKGITGEAIRHNPETLLLPPPTFIDFLTMMKSMPTSSEAMRLSLLERLEKAAYLFPGLTSIALDKALTVFSIRTLDEKWYPLMTFVVQNFLYRHRALQKSERYLAYVVEEASYMLRHPAGRKYLEQGSRGFRKRGIAQITLSQHPRDFLEEGQVILSNAGTAFFFGMQRNAAEKLQLSEGLEHILTDATPGEAVMRCGNTYAALTIANNPALRTIFTTDPRDLRKA